jgi:hypothetical protein
LAIPYVAMLVGLVGLDHGWIAFLLYHAGVLVAMRQTAPRPRITPRRTPPFWVLPRAVGVGLAVGFGALGGILLELLWPVLVPGDLSVATDAYLTHLGLEGPARVSFVAYHVLVNPVIEERFWRRHLATASRRFDTGDVAFAGYHLVVLAPLLPVAWLVVTFGVLVVAGWVWRQVAVASGSLVLPVVSHLAADAAVMAVVVHRVGW